VLAQKEFFSFGGEGGVGVSMFTVNTARVKNSVVIVAKWTWALSRKF
jgi:hypothetical protein